MEGSLRGSSDLLLFFFTQVIFDGEEAVDAGGVTKEFFLLLLKELMDPVYGMFTFHTESNLLWFSDKVSVFSWTGFLLLSQNMSDTWFRDYSVCD